MLMLALSPTRLFCSYTCESHFHYFHCKLVKVSLKLCICEYSCTVLVMEKHYLPDTISSFKGRAQSRMINEWQPSMATTVKL